MSQSERMQRTVSTLSAALMVSTFAGAALAVQAAPSDDHAQTVVRYDDLNLASDAGTHALYRRLRAGAHRVCDIPGTREMKLLIISQNCYEKALLSAVKAVHSERLSSLYQTSHGNGPG